MEVLSVTGGSQLRGTVDLHGAKNSVLPILTATLLCGGPCVLHNCPDITDVRITLEILESLGCLWQRDGDTVSVDASGLRGSQVPGTLACCLRSSVLFAGALLARMGCAGVPMPGGCPLGKRPVDLHLAGFEKMGASVSVEDCVIRCRCKALRPAKIRLPYPSVGATENLLLAAMGCPGEVELCGAAREPEIEDLANFLNCCGAKIEGAGSSSIRICGGKPLHGTEYTVMPDRMEAATYLCACAGCGGDLRLRRGNLKTILPLAELLGQCGCRMSGDAEEIRIRSSGRLHMEGSVETAPYPGFPTDAQAVLMAALLRAEGTLRIRETVFEDRFRHVPELRKLGAQIELDGQTAQLRGVSKLRGAGLCAGDLRGAAALVIGALQCPEKSVITGVKHLKRGYDNLEKNLQTLGAEISLQNL